MQQALHLIHFSHDLATDRLGIGIIASSTRNGADPSISVICKAIQHALQSAGAATSDGPNTYLWTRDSVQRSGVNGIAGAITTKSITYPMHSIFGYKNILYLDILAARRLETKDIPGTDNLIVRARYETSEEFTLVATAEEDPVSMVHATRKLPASAEAIATSDGGGHTSRLKSRSNQLAVVLAPDISCGPVIEQGHLKIVHPHDAIDPGRGQITLAPTAEEDPVSMVHATRQLPASAEAIATSDGGGHTSRLKSRSNQLAVVLAPDISCGPVIEQGHLKIVHPHDAIDPGRGQITLG